MHFCYFGFYKYNYRRLYMYIYILMLKLTKLRIFNICVHCVAPVNSIGKMSKFIDLNENN